MPRRKPNKTKKSVVKRFKITAKGKVLRRHSGKRHLMSSKSGKRVRRLGRSARVHETDEQRIKDALPFHH